MDELQSGPLMVKALKGRCFTDGVILEEWLEDPCLYTDLIFCITGLPLKGHDLDSLFLDEKNEKDLTENMKEKNHTFHGQCGMDVAGVCELTVMFSLQALSYKLLRKFRKD
jgi:hypothetical protein